jgi:hypothetical protein
MGQQTAMQIMHDELMAHEYTIPLDLIIKCKELIDVEKEQILDAFNDGDFMSCGSEKDAINYYNYLYSDENTSTKAD